MQAVKFNFPLDGRTGSGPYGQVFLHGMLSALLLGVAGLAPALAASDVRLVQIGPFTVLPTADATQDIRGRLQDKIMFGSDYPSLPYERILREWKELGYKDDVMEKIMHGNAERVLGL